MRLSALGLVVLSSLANAADVTVDVTSDRHPISPLIYGLNFGTDAQVARTGATVRRFGGNSWSRYNWKVSTTNEGGDGYFFRNLVLPGADGGFAPDYVDRLIAGTRTTSAASLIELPLIGWVARPGSSAGVPYACGFKVSSYGLQSGVDPTDPDCGNGVLPDGGLLYGNDPLDTSVAIDAGFATEWVQHLVAAFGSASDGGVRFYNLGNQPALWNSILVSQQRCR